MFMPLAKFEFSFIVTSSKYSSGLVFFPVLQNLIIENLDHLLLSRNDCITSTVKPPDPDLFFLSLHSTTEPIH